MGQNSSQIAILISILALIFSSIPQTDKELIDLQKEEARLSIEEKELNIQKLRKELSQKSISKEIIKNAMEIANNNSKIVTRRSNFYKELSSCKKVYQVGFAKLNTKNIILEQEQVVTANDFKHFIVTANNLTPLEISAARIEIVSPVLKEGNAKWKGIYDRKLISFYMKDTDFKNDVLSKKISFKNGSEIVCILHIHRKLNEIGEIVISDYFVETVLENIDSGISEETQQGKKYKNKQKIIKTQIDLFADQSV